MLACFEKKMKMCRGEPLLGFFFYKKKIDDKIFISILDMLEVNFVIFIYLFSINLSRSHDSDCGFNRLNRVDTSS
jgi:hypothetical protein